MNGRPLQSTLVGGGIYSFSVAAPLNCILGNCENLFPLFASSNVRIQLSLDNIATVIKNLGTNAPVTVANLSNVELCFDMIDFGSQVENIIKANDKFYIKSESYSVATQSLPAFRGTAELNFNMRLSSIKSLWASNGGMGSTNGVFDSFDLTQRKTDYATLAQTDGGDYSFTIASRQYPDRVLSTITNKQSVFLESQFARGHAVNDVGMADNGILSTSLYYANNAVGNPMIPAPSQFYVGVNTEKLRSNNYLLSGISTNNSAITYRINCVDSTGSTNAISLIAVYDALIEIDPVLRNATVKQ